MLSLLCHRVLTTAQKRRERPGRLDNVMTDLITRKLPFGLNRSMTHRTRIERSTGVPWELLDTSMRSKQGLGSLVRCEGLPKNRRFFVLDGRLNDPIFKNYLGHIRRIMAAYPARTWSREALSRPIVRSA